MSEPTKSPQQEDSRERKQRRPYEPPAIEESSQFETLALACALQSGFDCTYGSGYNNS